FSTMLQPTNLHLLSLHDALPISESASTVIQPTLCRVSAYFSSGFPMPSTINIHATISFLPSSERLPSSRRPWEPPLLPRRLPPRSEEHTSELQSRSDLVCRLLLE